MGYPMRFRDGIYACASEQYVAVPNVGVFGPYAAGIKPVVRMPSGRKGIQVEEAVTNLQGYSRRQDLWLQSDTISTGNIADPVGGLSAFIVQDNNPSAPGYLYRHDTNSVSGMLVTTVYVKYVDWQFFIQRTGSDDLHISIYDLINNICAGYAGLLPDFLGIQELKNGYKLSWMAKNVGAGSNDQALLMPSAAIDLITCWESAPVGSAIVWEAIRANCNHIPSVITTPGAGSVTKAKSELYFPAAKIPTVLRKRFSCDITPYWSNAMPVAPRYLWSFADSTETISCYFDNADKKIKVVGSVTGLFVQSAALTLAPFTSYACSWDADTGKQTIAGAEVTGTAWATADGNLYWGMLNDLSGQFNGVVSEPVIAWV